MKKRLAVIFAAVMASVLTMGLLSGCDEEADQGKHIPYHAQGVIGGDVKESFLYAEENRISIAYPNENYDPNDPDSEEYFFDPNLPSSRVVLLTEQAQLEEAFEIVPAIDLNTTMVFIVIFSATGNYKIAFENVKVENEVLEVIIKNDNGGIATAPRLMHMAIQMDRMKIIDTKVTFIKE